jgi:hypothetical protein
MSGFKRIGFTISPALAKFTSSIFSRLGTWAMVMNGSTSEANCGTDASLDDIPDSAEFTIELWVNWTGGEDDYPGFACKLTAGDDGWFIYGRVTTDRIGASVHCVTTNAGSHKEGTGILNTGWHHLAFYYDDTGDRKYYIALDGVWVSSYSLQRASVGAYVSDAVFTLKIGRSRTTRNVEGAIGWMRISDNDRYSHEVDFTPPARDAPPDVDANTIEQWNADEGAGTTLTASVNSPANDGSMTDVTWARM